MINKIELSSISYSDFNKIYRLNYRKEGFLQRAFKLCKSKNLESYVYFIIDRILIGHALVFKYENNYYVMTYIRESHRRQGFGSKLFDQICLDFPEIHIFGHDYCSNSFFSKLQEKYSLKDAWNNDNLINELNSIRY